MNGELGIVSWGEVGFLRPGYFRIEEERILTTDKYG